MSDKRKITNARCEECPLVKAHGMRGRGSLREDGTAEIMFIGEGPGRTEVQQRQVFVGPSGEILTKLIEGHKFETYWITNAALCNANPPDDKVKEAAAQCCRERLLDEIERVKPRVIVTLGNIPTDMLLGKGPKITKRRGVPVGVTLHGVAAKVVPTYHPAYILRAYTNYPALCEDFATAKKLLSPGRVSTGVIPPTYIATDNYMTVLDHAERSPFAVFDVETTGLNIITDEVLFAVIATADYIFIVPRETFLREDCQRAFNNCKARWSGHNAKFDWKMMMSNFHIDLNFTFDTMLAHYLFDERQGVHGLKDLAIHMYGAPDWEAPIQEALQAVGSKSYGDVPRETLYQYAAWDGYWQRKLTWDLARQLAGSQKLSWLFKRIMMPCSRALAKAELKGIKIDGHKLNALRAEYERRAQAEVGRLILLAGKEFNPNSPVQVAKVMYDDLRIPQILGQGRSTNAKTVLEKYTPGEYAFVDSLRTYRDIHTILKMYLNALPEYAVEGRVHTTFNLHGTVTGRLSSQAPNLQNIPRDNNDIKLAFIADPGEVFVYSDFSQIELRMAGILSGDEFLTKVYTEGGDLHAESAKQIFGPEITKEQRSLAKGFNFGLLYDRGEEAIIADGTYHMSSEEAHRVVARFHATIAGVMEYKRDVRAAVLRNHYVETPLGRRRRFPLIPNDRSQREEILRQAFNMMIQSSASDANLYSLAKLDAAGFDLRLTVHDSIMTSCEERLAEECLREQEKIMVASASELYQTVIPFVVESTIGRTWGEMEA